jgi:glycogen operon protein
MAMHYMINAYQKNLEFDIPETLNSKPVIWNRWIDTSRESPEDICLWVEGKKIESHSYLVPSHSIVILICKID